MKAFTDSTKYFRRLSYTENDPLFGFEKRTMHNF
jgi:hypothetical protein